MTSWSCAFNAIHYKVYRSIHVRSWTQTFVMYLSTYRGQGYTFVKHCGHVHVLV